MRVHGKSQVSQLPLPWELFEVRACLDRLVLAGFGTDIFCSPFPLGGVVEQRRADPEQAKELFIGWRNADAAKAKKHLPWDKAGRRYRQFELMAQLPLGEHAQHPAAHTFGSVHLYGGRDGSLDVSSILAPPLSVGYACTIRAASRVMGPAVIGNRVYLGGNVAFERSIVLAGSRIEVGAIVKDAVLGHDVKIGPGACLTSHYDGARPGSLLIRDFRQSGHPLVDTGRPIMGPIVGDRCIVLGHLLPGTVLLPGCYVPPHAVLEPGIYSRRELPLPKR